MKNIVLIGMSGTGKTTIGEELSISLNMDFVDTDTLIENKTGISIEKIFSLYGEDYFRKLESEIVRAIYQKKNQVISTGGGIVLNKDNIIKLKKNGVLVLLHASIDTIVKNIEKSKTVRPLLDSGEDTYLRVKSMYRNRKDMYLTYADIIISVEDKPINKIIYEILEKCVKINS